MKRPLKLAFFVSEDWYFCSHRLALARAALRAGFAVSVITHVQHHARQIEDAGISLIPIALHRGSRNPLNELRTVMQLIRAYRRLKPDIVHNVAMKPILYGTIAARMVRVPVVINALAGLGYLFSSTQLKARVLRPIVETVFRTLLRPHNVILQNPDDRRLLVDRGIADPWRTTLIRGSGVDIETFTVTTEPIGMPLVVLPARLLWDKGVGEFVEAARSLREQGVRARFALVGEPDYANPAAVPQTTLAAWREKGDVELWGWREDMVHVFQNCHVVCLPSYREGLPKALLEAAACGRALVTCDVPGCREVVQHGENGLLVKVRDPVSLADALRQLICDPIQRRAYGRKARETATTQFALDVVITQTLALYGGLAKT